MSYLPKFYYENAYVFQNIQKKVKCDCLGKISKNQVNFFIKILQKRALANLFIRNF